MRLESYPEAKKMPEKYLPSLVDAEIECWWSEPFSEYRICKNDWCKAIFSIEDVYWSVEEFQKRRELWVLDDTFCCEECWDETEYVYEKGEFISLTQEYVKKDVGCVIWTSDNNKVNWFWIISTTTVDSLLNLELNTRIWSYDKKELLKNISESIFWINDAWDEELLCLLHVYISPNWREKNLCFELLKSMFLLKENEVKKPIIMETRYDSRLYPISRLLWFKDLMSDKYGYVVQYLEQFSSIINFFKSNNTFFKPDLIWRKQLYKWVAMSILAQNPIFINRKFYN